MNFPLIVEQMLEEASKRTGPTKKKADKQRKAYYASRTTESLEFESKVAQLMSFEKKFEV